VVLIKQLTIPNRWNSTILLPSLPTCDSFDNVFFKQIYQRSYLITHLTQLVKKEIGFTI
jgi:hypothetical protein